MTNQTGATLLIVVGEPFNVDQKELIIKRIEKGLRSLDDGLAGCDVNKELEAVAAEGSMGEEGPNGERTVQYRSDSLSVQILVNPQLATLQSNLRAFFTSASKLSLLVYGGQVIQGTGSWVLQDDLFHFSSFAAIVKEADVENSLKQQEDARIHMHAFAQGDWSQAQLDKLFVKSVQVDFNPEEKLADQEGLNHLSSHLGSLINVKTPKDLLMSSDVVGNIRFNRPTLYVFPGCNGDSALFGINGFNLLVNGGYSRKACFWDFTRHLDRIDAMLVTHLGADNLFGVSTVLDRKAQDNVHPEIGYVYMNGVGRRKNSPNGDTHPENGAAHKPASLSVNLAEEGHRIIENLHLLGQVPATCLGSMQGKELKPVNLYHKVGHGTLDMYILNPMQDNKELKEFFAQWNKNVNSFPAKGGFPMPNMMSVCALLVWRPANENEKITRILFPGNAPQAKIFEGLDKLKALDIFQHGSCSEVSLKAPKPQKKAPAGKAASGPPKRTPPPSTPRAEPKKPSPPPSERKAPAAKVPPQSKVAKDAKNKKAGTQKEGPKSSKSTTPSSTEAKSPAEPVKPVVPVEPPAAPVEPPAAPVDDVPEIKPVTPPPAERPAEIAADPTPAWTEPAAELPTPTEAPVNEEIAQEAEAPMLVPATEDSVSAPPQVDEQQGLPSPQFEEPSPIPEPEMPEVAPMMASTPEVKDDLPAEPLLQLAESDKIEADQIAEGSAEHQPSEMPEALPDPIEDDMFAPSQREMLPCEQFQKVEEAPEAFEEPKKQETVPDTTEADLMPPQSQEMAADVQESLPDPGQFDSATFDALAQSQELVKEAESKVTEHPETLSEPQSQPLQDLTPTSDYAEESKTEQETDTPYTESDTSSLPSHSEVGTSEPDHSGAEPLITPDKPEAQPLVETKPEEMPRQEEEDPNKRELEDLGIYDDDDGGDDERQFVPDDDDIDEGHYSPDAEVAEASLPSSTPQPSLEELGIYDSEPVTSMENEKPTPKPDSPELLEEKEELYKEDSVVQPEQPGVQSLVDFGESAPDAHNLEPEGDIDEDSLIETVDSNQSQMQQDILAASLRGDVQQFDPNLNPFNLGDGAQDLPPLDCGNTNNPFLGMMESTDAPQTQEEPKNIPQSNGHTEGPPGEQLISVKDPADSHQPDAGTCLVPTHDLERDSLEREEPEKHSFDPLKDWGEPMGLPAPDDGNPKKPKRDGAAANGAAKPGAAKPTSATGPKKAPAPGKKAPVDAKKNAPPRATPTARKPASAGATGRAALDKTMDRSMAEPSKKPAGGVKKPPSGRPSTVPAAKAEAKSAPTKRSSVGNAKVPPAAKAAPLKPVTPFHVDLTYVPNHGDSNYIDIDFFRRVRARYYVISALCPNPALLNAFLEAKEMWEDVDAEVTIIPTYDTEILRHWMALHRDKLSQLKVDVAPSASRCTIQLQDHETSCAAYRLEF